MDNVDKLMALGVENCHPKLIGVVPDDKGVPHRVFVGEFVDGEVHLNDAGRALLAGKTADTSKRTKTTKKSADAPSGAPETDTDSGGTEDDLDL